jgi:hypothetical protein
MSNHKTIYLAVTVPADFMPSSFAQNIRELVQGYSDAIYVNSYEGTDAISREADRIKAAEYRETVRGVTEEIVQAVKDGGVTDRDDLETRLHEDIDGHHDVIYTYAAMEVIMQSSNSGAYVEQFGTDGVVEDGEIQWSRLAYAALLADVNEELSQSDEIDLNADDLGYFECEDCNKRFQRSAWESVEHSDCCTACAENRCTECGIGLGQHDEDCSLRPEGE